MILLCRRCAGVYRQLLYILNQRTYRLLLISLCTPVTHNVSTSDETVNSAAVTRSVQFNQSWALQDNSYFFKLLVVSHTAVNWRCIQAVVWRQTLFLIIKSCVMYDLPPPFLTLTLEISYHWRCCHDNSASALRFSLDSGSSTVSPLLPFKDSCEMLEVAIIYLFILTLLEQ